MPFTANELADLSNMRLETYLDRGTIWKQDVANKPMLDAFNRAAGKFVGGKEYVSFAVGSGYGGGVLQGYTGDDQNSYYNPTGSARARFPWKEHHIGVSLTMTELKTDGIDVVEDGSDQSMRDMSERETAALANIFDEKVEKFGADYTFSLDRLIHGDGSVDTKALAGIRSIILDNPNVGIVGGVNAASQTWWRNRAATAAYGGAGGQGAIVSNTANGGALVEFLDNERRFLTKYTQGSTRLKWFAGSDFIAAHKRELRANGRYTDNGWKGKAPDGAMDDPSNGEYPIVWDPTLDETGYSKRCYAIDMGKTGVRLLYMDGQRMKRHNPARPYDRYVTYQAVTMTGVMAVKQRNTSAVYDIA